MVTSNTSFHTRGTSSPIEGEYFSAMELYLQWEKPGTNTVIRLNRAWVNSRPCADLRTWYQPRGEMGWLPGKGISIPWELVGECGDGLVMLAGDG